MCQSESHMSHILWHLSVSLSDGIDMLVERYCLQKVSLLRSVCKHLGIQILLRDYNMDNRTRQTFLEEDIINVYPNVKHIHPKVCTLTVTLILNLTLPCLIIKQPFNLRQATRTPLQWSECVLPFPYTPTAPCASATPGWVFVGGDRMKIHRDGNHYPKPPFRDCEGVNEEPRNPNPNPKVLKHQWLVWKNVNIKVNKFQRILACSDTVCMKTKGFVSLLFFWITQYNLGGYRL